MNTTYVEDCTAIAVDLDDGPKCKKCARPAEYWLKSHGCMGALACETHKQEAVDYLNAGLAKAPVLECTGCHQPFVSVTAYVTIITL